MLDLQWCNSLVLTREGLNCARLRGWGLLRSILLRIGFQGWDLDGWEELDRRWPGGRSAAGVFGIFLCGHDQELGRADALLNVGLL
jgi:hypothetical protein